MLGSALGDGLTEGDAAALILKILQGDMEKILTRYIAAQRGQIVAAFENWWDKYRVTLTEIDTETTVVQRGAQRPDDEALTPSDRRR